MSNANGNIRIVFGSSVDDERLQALPGRKVFYKTKRQAANAYRAAARFLEKNPERWTRGTLWKGYVESNTPEGISPAPTCKVCAVGALNLANLDDPRGLKAEEMFAGGSSTSTLFQGYLLELEGTERKVLDGRTIVVYNDNIAKGPTDVVKALRKVARALDHGAAMEAAGNFKVQEV
jgi:hypothetical protein